MEINILIGACNCDMIICKTRWNLIPVYSPNFYHLWNITEVFNIYKVISLIPLTFSCAELLAMTVLDRLESRVKFMHAHYVGEPINCYCISTPNK